MSWENFTLWFAKQDSKGKSRIIAGSGVAVAVVFYLTSSLYSGLSRWSESRKESAEPRSVSKATIVPRYSTPPSRPFLVRNTPQLDPTVKMRQELEDAKASRAFRNQLVGDTSSGSGGWKTASYSASDSSTGAIVVERSAPPSLKDVSYVGWYELTGRGGESYTREKVEMTFSRFDPDRRIVEVQFRSLDNLDWGIVTYSGTFKPGQGSVFDVVIDKQNVGKRSIRCGVADLFGPFLNWYGRKAQLTLQVHGKNITGVSTDGHGTVKYEKLILTRLARDEVDRPAGPDPKLFRKDKDVDSEKKDTFDSESKEKA